MVSDKLSRSLKFFLLVAMATEFSMDFDRVPAKDHFCKVCLQLAMCLRRIYSLQKLLTSHDGARNCTLCSGELIRKKIYIKVFSVTPNIKFFTK